MIFVTTSVQLSVAVAVPVFAGNVLASQLIVLFEGQLITGRVVSWTVIVCMQVFEFVQESTDIHVLLIV